MDNNEFNEYREASWENVSRDGHGYGCSTIKFRNNRKRSRVKGLIKGIAFFLIAAVSGGATAYYVVDTKYSKAPLMYVPNNPSMLEQNTPTVDIPKNAISKVAETVGPTVVGISNQVESFFGEKTKGSGSGIIFDKKGYIVTNYHVIQGAAKVTIKLANSDKVFEAKFVGADPTRDIAVIKIDAENLPVAKFGDSSKVRVGDLAVAIGNPLGDEFAGTVTGGIISAVNRRIQVKDESGNVTTYKVIQTDAAINPGNSGGALCNEAGEIIGINSLKLGVSSNVEGMGFAININDVNAIIRRLMGKDVKPMLGIEGRSAVPQENNGVKGAYIQSVVKGSGAEEAGIKPLDIIVEADKSKIETFDDLSDIMLKHKVGDVITCKVWRNGKTIEVNIKLTEAKK